MQKVCGARGGLSTAATALFGRARAPQRDLQVTAGREQLGDAAARADLVGEPVRELEHVLGLLAVGLEVAAQLVRDLGEARASAELDQALRRQHLDQPPPPR